MREIKFRAWDGKEMHHNVSIVGSMAYKDGYCGNILNPGAKAGKPMQYTGLKDKNGKEIYEGDLLKFYYADIPGPRLWEVISNYAQFDFQCNTMQRPLNDQDPEEIEIIGNIYENPELL